MKAYSKSLGKVIDIPDNAQAQGAMPSGQGQMDTESMRKMFAVAALSNPKSASTLLSVFNLLSPKKTGNELSSTERMKAKTLKAAMTQVGQIEQQFQPLIAKKATGPIQGTWTNLMKNIAPGLVNKDLATLQSDIGPSREQVMNAISGVAVSPSEAERVMSWIPDIKKSSAENQRNINSLKNWLETNFTALTQPLDEWE